MNGLDRLQHERMRRIGAPVLDCSTRRAHGLLRSALRLGTLSDQQLDERAMITAARASRNAIRRSLKLLADDGIATRSPRRGTRIARSMVSLDVSGNGGAGTPRALGADLVHPVADAAARSAALGRGHHCPHRVETALHASDDVAVTLSRVYRDGDADDGAVEVEWGVAAARSDAVTAELLDVPVGSPVLVRTVVFEDVDGRFRGCRVDVHPGDRVALERGAA